MDIVYKEVKEVGIMKEIVLLQLKVWGAESVTSMPQLIAAVHHGGVVIGAFDDDEVVGFCYGFPGVGAIGEGAFLFSHMMAIHPDYRDQGIGMRLKEQQRSWALSYGYDKIAWTFDPLETRNAYLNLIKLGGTVSIYIENYYGFPDEPWSRNLPTDRFLVEWELHSTRCVSAIQGIEAHDPRWSTYARLFEWQLEAEYPSPQLSSLTPTADGYMVPVPRAISSIKQTHMELAVLWRLELRRHLTQAFACGYRIVGLLRTEQPVHYYVLEKAGQPELAGSYMGESGI